MLLALMERQPYRRNVRNGKKAPGTTFERMMSLQAKL